MRLVPDRGSVGGSLPPEYADTDMWVRDCKAGWMPASEYAGQLGVALHVITAWNPGSRRPGDAPNREANEALRADLDKMGADTAPAMGCGRSIDHTEESWAVTGLSGRRARHLGRRYGQTAIFHIAVDGTTTAISCRRFRPATMTVPPG